MYGVNFICDPGGSRTQLLFPLKEGGNATFCYEIIWFLLANGPYMWNICLNFTFSFNSFHFYFILLLARDVEIESTHRGFGDLTDTLSVSRIYFVNVTPLVQLLFDMI